MRCGGIEDKICRSVNCCENSGVVTMSIRVNTHVHTVKILRDASKSPYTCTVRNILADGALHPPSRHFPKLRKPPLTSHNCGQTKHCRQASDSAVPAVPSSLAAFGGRETLARQIRSPSLPKIRGSQGVMTRHPRDRNTHAPRFHGT